MDICDVWIVVFVFEIDGRCGYVLCCVNDFVLFVVFDVNDWCECVGINVDGGFVLVSFVLECFGELYYCVVGCGEIIKVVYWLIFLLLDVVYVYLCW